MCVFEPDGDADRLVPLYCSVRFVGNFQKADVLAKWEATAWAKKRAMRAKRANLTDFDRFKVMVAKKQRSKAIQEKLSA